MTIVSLIILATVNIYKEQLTVSKLQPIKVK